MDAFTEMRARWTAEETELKEKMAAMKRAQYEEAKTRALKSREKFEAIMIEVDVQKKRLADVRKTEMSDDSVAVIRCDEELDVLQLEMKKVQLEMIAFESFYAGWSIYPPS
jgi:uncharacterized protein related to proFAR isomerase